MIARYGKSRKWLALAIFSLAAAGLVIVGLTDRNPISEIEKLGGTIERRSDRTPPKVVVWLDRKGWSEVSKWISMISRRFSPVVTVELRDQGVTDDHLVHIKGLSKLEWLFLNDTQITDAGLAQLKDLTQLRDLFLNDTQITDAGLVHLRGLTQIGTLNLSNTQVTDAGLAHLKGLTQLRHLYLSDTQVTDAGLTHLKRWTQLNSLNLSGTQVTQKGSQELLHALPDLNLE